MNGTKIQMRRYACETRVVSGLGVLSLLPDELKYYKIKNPALVSDAGIANAGLLEKWFPPEISGLKTRILSKVNPNLDDANAASELARSNGCDGVIIVGGGSALCLGKAVSIMLTNPGQISQYEGDSKTTSPPAPTIAIPTTAGSGSEVSRVLVLHEKGRDIEIIVRGYGTEPRVALLDGTVLKDCPRRPFLEASLDAITHACESLWVRNRSIITDGMAEKALRTFIRYLPAAVNDRDPQALQAIIEASSAANLACGNTGLGLVHALTTSPEVPLAHGYQNAAILLAVCKFNREIMDPEHQELIDQLPALYETLKYPTKYAADDIDDGKAALMVKASTGHPFRMNNARSSSDEDCMKIIRESGATLRVGA